MTPELSRRLGEAVGTRIVSPQEQKIIRDAAALAQSWADLPADVQQLVVEIESRPGTWEQR